MNFKKLKIPISLKNNYFLLLILPYVIYTIPNIFMSSINNSRNLTIYLLILFILNYLFNKINCNIIKIIITNIIVVTFYSPIILPLFSKVSILLAIKLRYLFLFFIALINLLFFVFYKKRLLLQTYILYYLVILNILVSINTFKIITNNKNKIYNTNKIISERIVTSDSSILLIILDEYASPIELDKLNRNLSNHTFSKKLMSSGWKVNKSFYSHETKTIKSISSLFNLNLSQNPNFIKKNFKFCEPYFINTTLISSLATKEVNFINWGIFNINYHKAISNDIYPFPITFNELFFSNSIVNILIYNFNNYNERPVNKHNIKIFNFFENYIIPPHSFVYSHLLMPHAPFDFYSEFRYDNNISYDSNYINYWHFTNKKLSKYLTHIKRNNPNLKIILTGDHGYRDNEMINSNYTFAAFWGFTSNELKDIHSVQDIGKLISISF